MRLSPDAITSLLTSLFPSGMIDDLAREREVVVRERKLDVRVLVWTLIVGFAVGGEARSIAAYRRTYNGATGQKMFPSSFYDRFTPSLEQLLRDLLDHRHAHGRAVAGDDDRLVGLEGEPPGGVQPGDSGTPAGVGFDGHFLDKGEFRRVLADAFVFRDNLAHNNGFDRIRGGVNAGIMYPFATSGHGLFTRAASIIDPEHPMVFERFTTYKNHGHGAWLEDPHEIMVGSILTDSPVGVMARDSVVRDTLIVGYTSNGLGGQINKAVGILGDRGFKEGAAFDNVTIVNANSAAVVVHQTPGTMPIEAAFEGIHRVNTRPIKVERNGIGAFIDPDGAWTGDAGALLSAGSVNEYSEYLPFARAFFTPSAQANVVTTERSLEIVSPLDGETVGDAANFSDFAVMVKVTGIPFTEDRRSGPTLRAYANGHELASTHINGMIAVDRRDYPHSVSTSDGVGPIDSGNAILSKYPILDTEVVSLPVRQSPPRWALLATLDEQLAGMGFLWKVCKHVKSNAIVYAKGSATAGIDHQAP